MLRNRLWSVIIVSGALVPAWTLVTAQTAATAPTAATSAPQNPVNRSASTAAKPSGAASASAHKSSGKRRKSHKSGVSSRKRGQQAIDPKRAQEIQAALIREHYLSGEPHATWNDSAQKAMQRYQADHGWQSKQVPDSRALIELGLGPDREHLLNPESAMTTPAEGAHSRPAPASAPAAPADTDRQRR